MATAPSGMLPDYRITVQSTKVAINGDGIIGFRAGYGVKADDIWHQVFRQLTSG